MEVMGWDSWSGEIIIIIIIVIIMCYSSYEIILSSFRTGSLAAACATLDP